MEDNSQVVLLLNNLQNFERGPKGLADSWRETQQAAEDSVERVLLKEGGFPVWFAHYVAKNDAAKSSRFAGKAAIRNLIADLEDQPLEHLKLLAATVASQIDSATLAKVEQVRRTRIEFQTKNMSQNSNKRPREYAA